MDLTLDRLKQKESTKRVQFLHSLTFQYSKNMTVSNGKGPACEEQNVFLRVSVFPSSRSVHAAGFMWMICFRQDDRDFRDKITPISVVMEYSLDYQQAADPTGLLPILDVSAPSNVTKQVTASRASVRGKVAARPHVRLPPPRPTFCWTVEKTTSVNPTSGCR